MSNEKSHQHLQNRYLSLCASAPMREFLFYAILLLGATFPHMPWLNIGTASAAQMAPARATITPFLPNGNLKIFSGNNPFPASDIARR